METFVAPRPLVDNPDFASKRRANLSSLDLSVIDKPIVDVVEGFSRLPYCFTLQSCYGHFVYGKKGKHNLDPLPDRDDISEVEYRIAYFALCIEDSDEGRALYRDLINVPQIDPDYVQFGSAGWFWQRQVNTYALQVEPDRYKTKDNAMVDYQEALHIEEVRDRFFDEIRLILKLR